MGGLKPIESKLAKLGKYKTGKGCLYIKSLGDVNGVVLQKIFASAFKAGQRNSPQKETV